MQPDKSSKKADDLGELARAALAEQHEEDVLPLLAQETATNPDPRLWQWKGLLERAVDDHSQALKSFANAAKYAPEDAGIAHGHARVALEAGLPALELFDRALRLAPSDAQVYLGLNAARIAAGKADEAEAELDRILAASPMFLDGHRQLAQIRALLGRREEAYDSIERAIAAQPQQAALWQALFDLQIQAEDYRSLESAVGRARASDASFSGIAVFEFIAASELGQVERADHLLKKDRAALPATWLLRHYLRSGQLEPASALVDCEIRSSQAAYIWPYAATLWRLTGDPRLEWLTGDPNLISVTNLSDRLASIPSLADTLRSLHQVSGQYLNQSVRGGSQTDGALFSRIEPDIRALRSIIVEAVEQYRRGLSSLPDNHPQATARERRKVRFSGSWSVRLVDGGFHTDHVHTLGWISSALYVSLPANLDESEPYGGWLALGAPPPELGLDLEPTRMIKPKTGQLVLFPSWMWHGTRPFAAGERLTVAFDVAPPPQSSSSS